jgi:hypothetical protein
VVTVAVKFVLPPPDEPPPQAARANEEADARRKDRLPVRSGASAPKRMEMVIAAILG